MVLTFISMTNATSTEGQIDSTIIQTLEEFPIPCNNVLKKILTKQESEQVAIDLDKLVEHPNAKENLEKVKEFHSMLTCFLDELKKYNSDINTRLEENAVKNAAIWLVNSTTLGTKTPYITTTHT